MPIDWFRIYADPLAGSKDNRLEWGTNNVHVLSLNARPSNPMAYPMSLKFPISKAIREKALMAHSLPPSPGDAGDGSRSPQTRGVNR